jgi:TolB protein
MHWALFFLFLQAPGTLELKVTSESKPAAARIYIVDSDGHSHPVPGAINYTRRGALNSTIDGSAAITLPPGKYHVRAEKGMEYRKAEQDIEIKSGETAKVSLDVLRFSNMNQRGWYSGDLHNHRSPDEMPLLARAEDLNVSPVITRHVGGPNRPGAEPFPQKDFITVDATHVVSLHNQEVERLFAGHGAVDLLNAPHPVDAPRLDLFPMDLDYCRQARRDGAFLDAEKPIWKNTPVNVAFGMVDAIGVVNNHFHPEDVMVDGERLGSLPRDKPIYQTPAGFAQWMMDLYYSFLNCGFRIPVSAGSASGVMTSWPGYERVYVHMDGKFTYEDWFRGLKAGHSFATNGPILLVTANGKLPGNEFVWKKAVDVALDIEANSQDLLDRIEIISNGETLRTMNVNKHDFHDVVRIRMDRPGWLAVRCFEPVGATVRYAHTTPFWFTQNGRLPVQKSDAQHWADYTRELAASVKPEQYPSREAYEKAQQTFREASQIYAARVSGLRAGISSRPAAPY